MRKRSLDRGRSPKGPRAVAAIGAFLCAFWLAACEPDILAMPILVVDNGDGSATVTVPVCMRDALFRIEVAEDQNSTALGNAGFSGDLPLNATDGAASFDLAPDATTWTTLAGLKIDRSVPYRTVPRDFRGLGALSVDTLNSTAFVRLDLMPASASGAWLVSANVAGGDVVPTTETDGETTINSWCADQRGSASAR
jgi:hypothetical protein